MPSPTPATRYRGDFVTWPGGAGLIGLGGGGTVIDPHSHYAIQLAIGMPNGLRVRSGRHGEWEHCAAALFPSRITHTIDVTGCEWSAVLFIEPETPAGRALTARMNGQMQLLDAGAIAAGVQRLEHTWLTDRDREAVQATCAGIFHELAGTAYRPPSDPRVLAAIDYIRDRVDQPIALPDVARATNLSPGRFRHLFVEETGMPLRTYVLWRRLLHVYALLTQGENLSSAAHSAGFADSAHLSRTARTMFGLPPSALTVTGPLTQHDRTPHAHFG